MPLPRSVGELATPIFKRYAPRIVVSSDFQKYGPRAANVIALDTFLREGVTPRGADFIFNSAREYGPIGDAVQRDFFNAGILDEARRKLQAENALDRLVDTVTRVRTDLPVDTQYGLYDPAAAEVVGDYISPKLYGRMMDPVTNAFTVDEIGVNNPEVYALDELLKYYPGMNPRRIQKLMELFDRGADMDTIVGYGKELGTNKVPFDEALELIDAMRMINE